jgi:hypothetical protein
MEGWYKLDSGLLIASSTKDFTFDDPLEPAPVTQDNLAHYMHRWDAWARELGAENRWRLSNEVRQDKDGILTDWEWWEIPGTALSGSAVIKTRDEGVFLERITYFSRESLPLR